MLTEQKPESIGRLMYTENRIFNTENFIILRLCHPEPYDFAQDRLFEGRRIK